MIAPSHLTIPIVRQCALLAVPRSTYYYEPAPDDPATVALMRQIDGIYTRHPYYGSPRVTARLQRDGLPVNHKRIERLMALMGLQALYPAPRTSTPHPAHTVYPYLLRGLAITTPNQVWGTDLTYVRARDRWFYLMAIMDWFSRYVISWQLSPSLSVGSCVAALREALATARPGIHNSDQGSQYTAGEYLGVLRQYPDIRISMDGRGRCFDNIFTERLWRTVKYEEVYVHDYRSYPEAADSLRRYFHTYNHERLHQALDYQTPAEVYFQSSNGKGRKANGKSLFNCG